MKYIFLLLISFVLFNCEDKQSNKKTNTPLIETSKNNRKNNQKKNKTKTEVKAKETIMLTDANAMEFFLQYGKKNPESKVRLTTSFGTIDILLFHETKFHRANFIFLTKQRYFDGTQFYRVIDNFIVQAGNSDDPKISKKRTEIGRYLLPTDTKRGFKHDRGVISMPSSDIENPYKLASPFEFFIVQQEGGAHHLDGSYTIFGKVINGMDVVDKIAKQKTDDGDWPMHNVYIETVRVIK